VSLSLPFCFTLFLTRFHSLQSLSNALLSFFHKDLHDVKPFHNPREDYELLGVNFFQKKFDVIILTKAGLISVEIIFKENMNKIPNIEFTTDVFCNFICRIFGINLDH